MYVTCHCTKKQQQIYEEAPMSKKATTTAKPSIYQTVTERIIASLKRGHESRHFSNHFVPKHIRPGWIRGASLTWWARKDYVGVLLDGDSHRLTICSSVSEAFNRVSTSSDRFVSLRTPSNGVTIPGMRTLDT
jgi:hypothetical protein